MKIEKQLKLLPKQPLRLSVEPPLLYKFLFFFYCFFHFFLPRQLNISKRQPTK